MFPLAITILSFGLACCVLGLWMAETPAQIVPLALLSSLTALALIEHWLMVVPLPDAKLWRWMLPPPSDLTQKESKTHGL
jgi:putative photosynthetic complex assembly protein 2